MVKADDIARIHALMEQRRRIRVAVADLRSEQAWKFTGMPARGPRSREVFTDTVLDISTEGVINLLVETAAGIDEQLRKLGVEL